MQSNVAASNAKLALFYDWLFFNPEKDSIMNIGEDGGTPPTPSPDTAVSIESIRSTSFSFLNLHCKRVRISEPAILVMHHSMKPHPAITATLLDFMCRVSRVSASRQNCQV